MTPVPGLQARRRSDRLDDGVDGQCDRDHGHRHPRERPHTIVTYDDRVADAERPNDTSAVAPG